MKKTVIAFVIVLVAVAGVLWFVMYNDGNDVTERVEDDFSTEGAAYKYPPKPTNTVIKKQKKMEQKMLQESEGSTLSDPYVKLDPYNRAPLAALIMFETKEKSTVTFKVKSKHGDADITKTMNHLKTEHQLPVLGLYPNYKNKVVIKAKTVSGKTKKKTVHIKTGKLPKYLPDITIKTVKRDLIDMPENSLTFAIPSTKYPYAFDLNGDIRWYSSTYNSHVFKQLENGNYLYLGKDSNSGDAYNRLREMNLMGRIYNAFKISQKPAHSEAKGLEKTLIHHDASELPNGNFILTVNDDDGTYIEDTMIEIDRQTGEVVKRFDLKKLFPEGVYENYTNDNEDNAIDWFHQNAVVYDESDSSLVISGRNQDAVMKIDYETGEIIWILAPPEDWKDKYDAYLVEGKGKNFKFPAGQHDPTIMPDFDNNPDTIDLLIYDNNIVKTRGNDELSGKYSAGTHYRINEKTMEAKIIWTYGKERGETLFTEIIGSAKYLEKSGNRLIDFGFVNDGKRSHIVEVTEDENPKVVFEAIATDFPTGAWVYRAQRHTLYSGSWVERYQF
ncbi:aryl-sulfate sulfotransferase [Virgibacillus siamensis]|uniref:aryl-sulfate sulfotransferase n=1 Tax=Virgibacillus siamensis TaxID=480071 RepID=UPI0011154B42|nr:aryl-sulfate sulfotransferase [Virgibacillus siamensis]